MGIEEDENDPRVVIDFEQGGYEKATETVAAPDLAQSRRPVMIVDADPQPSASAWALPPSFDAVIIDSPPSLLREDL
ncbi:hypothetical protein GCM10022224_035310 [Nonomuraea antimicrobica]|uniref:Chromosome partitioning protein n=1 Tax=Nonomuraea antimicrobica TaxID=561173 RepID=A0ABP7BRI3_9ACTN